MIIAYDLCSSLTMTDDNDLWRFSLRVYGAPNVAQECLALQDRFGMDVNVLLFCAWLGAARGTALSADELQDCEAAVSEWQERCVRPLRNARRAMKGLPGAEDLRAEIKKLELDAEKCEQQTLYALALQRWPAHGHAARDEALANNLDLFLRAHGASASGGAPALLAAAARNHG
jgi:uncharacterized protein (TIGR02444 family)